MAHLNKLGQTTHIRRKKQATKLTQAPTTPTDELGEPDLEITIIFRRPRHGDKTGYIAAEGKYAKRDGESWNRYSDVTDGDFSKATLNEIIGDLVDEFEALREE